MSADEYVHGRSARESERLDYQASRLAGLLHAGTCYPAGSLVLEAACGVGAQTVILARNNPFADFVSIDISAISLAAAEVRVRDGGIPNVTFHQADIYSLPFLPATFDHIFVCFLLEHLPDPLKGLQRLKEVLKPGGTITVIEGDHGSAFFYPDSTAARESIRCLVELQARVGGNACIGRELWHLLNEAGFSAISVSPRTVYADAGIPGSGDAVKNIFIAMVEGVGGKVLEDGMLSSESWERGIRDLYRTTEHDGAFCYTFFKAVAWKERAPE
jgi:ubiquinone/menaquinone biosynthesis C-methylase UbiE